MECPKSVQFEYSNYIPDHSLTWAEHEYACNVNQAEEGELIKEHFINSTSVTSVNNLLFIFHKFVIELIEKKGIWSV